MADTLNAQVTVTGSPGVSLQTAHSDLETVQVGSRTWRRTTVEGKYTHGRTLIGAVMETEQLVIRAHFKAASWTAVMNLVAPVVAAFSQLSYTLTWTVEGRTVSYKCEPADITYQMEKFRAMANIQELTFTIPVTPGVV